MTKEVHEMHPNYYALWMVGGQPAELRSVARDRQQQSTLRESRRSNHRSLLARLRGSTAMPVAETDLACCPA